MLGAGKEVRNELRWSLPIFLFATHMSKGERQVSKVSHISLKAGFENFRKFAKIAEILRDEKKN